MTVVYDEAKVVYEFSSFRVRVRVRRFLNVLSGIEPRDSLVRVQGSGLG